MAELEFKKLSELPIAGVLDDADTFLIEQAGLSKSGTYAQIKQAVLAYVDSILAGDVDIGGNLDVVEDITADYIIAKSKRAVFVHQVADNTSGGSSTADAWTDLPLTTEVLDEIGITLLSNVLTIPAGTYDIEATHVLVNYNRGMLRLYNVTTGAEITGAFSIAEMTEQGVVSGTAPIIKHRVTFAVETQIKMQYYLTYAYATHGLGAAFNLTPDHVANFGRIIIDKVG